MLTGYVRVSRAGGSQVSDLQKDALLTAGVLPDRIYQDLASGRFDDRQALAHFKTSYNHVAFAYLMKTSLFAHNLSKFCKNHL